jgi:hypothetical protein
MDAMAGLGSVSASNDGNDVIVQGIKDRVSMKSLMEQYDADARNYLTDYPAGGVEEAKYLYGTTDASKGVTLSHLLDVGQETAHRTRLTPSDSICMPLTLNHSMGFGFGVLASIQAGSRLILPTTDTANATNTTMKVLTEDKCSVLFSDTHTLKDLPSDATQWLRCGVVKVGSGEEFGADETVGWGKVKFLSVGKGKP